MKTQGWELPAFLRTIFCGGRFGVADLRLSAQTKAVQGGARSPAWLPGWVTQTLQGVGTSTVWKGGLLVKRGFAGFCAGKTPSFLPLL